MCEEASAVQNNEIKGEDIDRIEYVGTLQHPSLISIYLKNGKMIEMIPQLRSSTYAIEPIIKVSEGHWGIIGS